MKGFVLDNSVVMARCLEDEASSYARCALDALSHSEAGVPALWPVEMLNVSLTAERRARIAPLQSARFLDLVEKLPIQIVSDSWSWTAARVLDRGRTFALSSYDATYLELAERLGVPLATEDRQLIRGGMSSGWRSEPTPRHRLIPPGALSRPYRPCAGARTRCYRLGLPPSPYSKAESPGPPMSP